MKLLHTGDWQLGMRAASVGEVGKAVRAARLEAGKRVVAVAEERRADCLLVAGDLFEDNGVDRVLVQQCADLLAAFSGPVYLIPGNHDPLMPGSVWEHPAWRMHENLHLLDKTEPVALPGGATLYPCPLFAKYSRKDPTAWIDAREERGIAIGLAHGNVEGIVQEEPDYPIPRDAASRSGLDYLALGHWHSTAEYSDNAGTPRMAYSGTHETTKFGERDSGNVLLVEIPERNAPPKLTSIRTGVLRWVSDSVTLASEGDLAQQRDRIVAMEAPEKTLLELRLDGLLAMTEEPILQEIRDLLEGRFMYARLDDTRLTPSPEDDAWIQQLPAGIMQQTAMTLQAQANAATPDTEEAQIATLALMQLYRLQQEGEAR